MRTYSHLPQQYTKGVHICRPTMCTGRQNLWCHVGDGSIGSSSGYSMWAQNHRLAKVRHLLKDIAYKMVYISKNSKTAPQDQEHGRQHMIHADLEQHKYNCPHGGLHPREK